MDQESQIETLLGAYISGEMTPEERAAIEALFDKDPSLKAQVEPLQELSAVLARAERPVTEDLKKILRQRVEDAVAERESANELSAILAASICGDLNSREEEILQKHLQLHPEANREIQSLRDFSGKLKRLEIPVNEKLSQRLAERLASRLPAGVLNASAAKSSIPARITQTAAPAVRIYAVPQRRWRLAWLGVAAALLLLAFGIAKLTNNPGSKRTGQPGEEVVKNGSHPNGNNSQSPVDSNPGQSPEERTAQGETPIDKPNETKTGVKPPQDANIANNNDLGPDSPDGVVPRNGQNSQKGPIVRNDRQDKSSPNSPAPKENNAIAEQNNGIPNTTDLPLPPNVHPQKPPIEPLNNSAVALAPGPTNPQTQKSTSGNETPPAQSTAVVEAIKDGSAHAVTPNGLEQLANNKTVASGSEVVTTDQSRLSLLLPDHSRLNINKNSNVKIEIEGDKVIVTLNSGEIKFKAAGAGSLELHSHGAEVASSRGVVDTKLQNNKLIVNVGDKTATVTYRKKDPPVKVSKGSTVVVDLGTDQPPVKDNAVQQDNWDADLNGTDTGNVQQHQGDPVTRKAHSK